MAVQHIGKGTSMDDAPFYYLETAWEQTDPLVSQCSVPASISEKESEKSP
jgi:hypothetical protein